MDGVLLDSFEAWFALMNAAAGEFGCAAISREGFQNAFGQSTEADAASFYPGRSSDDVSAYYITHFNEYAALTKATPGASALLDDLDALGIPTAVITNTHSAISRPLLEALDLVPHALIAVDNVAKGKPAPDMIFRGCEVLGLTPWDVLVVGDSRFDQQAAAAAGSAFAGFGGMGGNFTLAEINDVLSVIDGTFN